jgi:2C-methyl-D-erythritol 2,4-cyclodiphosphate synthase
MENESESKRRYLIKESIRRASDMSEVIKNLSSKIIFERTRIEYIIKVFESLLTTLIEMLDVKNTKLSIKIKNISNGKKGKILRRSKNKFE